MKFIQLVLVFVLTSFTTSVFAQIKKDTFYVAGNCGMCKKRIENSIKLPAVNSANWDVKTKTLTVNYDSTKISNEEIQKKIASVGHDTEQFTADKKIYESLPECCLYERKRSKESKSTHSEHHH